MNDLSPQPIYLKDYQEPAFWVDDVWLEFDLAPKSTRVTSQIKFRRNPNRPGATFFLHGEDLKLIEASINGTQVSPTPVEGGIEVPNVPDAFEWQCTVEISPVDNTALEGLYMSKNMYCTQCEAEGFRKITYYPDRPDVMAPFTVKIRGDAPVLLSNGNIVAQGEGWAEWHDPWPKPAYLFALVAGNLVRHRDTFQTVSGRTVDLGIYVRSGDEDKCDFAMQALKDSMAWDERVYAREYDLDIFNIVAVDDFNMGAMENKGLNIFNSAAVLANANTSTDANFERIEAIIAHEYFHNWTGNRITCRDWFQLCLKEGLTVFRDQQFSADMRSAAVRRIEDVLTLRARQFSEDAGPLAHPVRPESFVEINNFYTATIYEKGAELIGMLRRFVGAKAYDAALLLYFDRHDGEACTVEDWIRVFEDTTGKDLSHFATWYSQAGTPRIQFDTDWQDGVFTLTLRQTTPATPGQPNKQPLPMPVVMGLISHDGKQLLPETTLEFDQAEQTFRFEGIDAKPIASLFRGLSAPVVIETKPNLEDQIALYRFDTDAFNRWDAGRSLGKDALVRKITDEAPIDARYFEATADLLQDDTLDPAFRALCLAQISQDDAAQTLADMGVVPDPTKIFDARAALRLEIAEATRPRLKAIYETYDFSAGFAPDAEGAGRRALANTSLNLLTQLDGGTAAKTQFENAKDMTMSFAALTNLVTAGAAEIALKDFYARWEHERLVIDKWFNVQISAASPQSALTAAEQLAQHPQFDVKVPNRFRALIGGLYANPAALHDTSGRGYRLVFKHLAQADALNPQLAARSVTAFGPWRRYDKDRQDMIELGLRSLKERKGASRDMLEMTKRLLEG